MTDRIKNYFYEHENGQIIRKVEHVVDSMPNGPEDYFEGPFVRRWWHEDSPPENLRDREERDKDGALIGYKS